LQNLHRIFSGDAPVKRVEEKLLPFILTRFFAPFVLKNFVKNYAVMPATVPASVVLHKNWPRDGARGDSVQSGVTVRRCHASLSAGIGCSDIFVMPAPVPASAVLHKKLAPE